jgi:hypothetical protein
MGTGCGSSENSHSVDGHLLSPLLPTSEPDPLPEKMLLSWTDCLSSASAGPTRSCGLLCLLQSMALPKSERLNGKSTPARQPEQYGEADDPHGDQDFGGGSDRDLAG